MYLRLLKWQLGRAVAGEPNRDVVDVGWTGHVVIRSANRASAKNRPYSHSKQVPGLASEIQKKELEEQHGLGGDIRKPK